MGGEGVKGFDHTENTEAGDEQCDLTYKNVHQHAENVAPTEILYVSDPMGKRMLLK